jgi:spore coat polysaccharide biosynthesis protein SpsF
LHERLAAKAGEASLADLLLLLEREPSLRTNAHVKQKSIAAAGGLALIRCDGGGKYGYGHVKRMVALARALRDREGIGSVFAVNGTDDALKPIRDAGFEACPIDVVRDAADLDRLISTREPDVLISDMREGVSGEDLLRLSQKVELTAVVDDGSDRRLAADVAYYPPVPQAYHLDWGATHCVPRIGWEWSLLGLDKITPSRRSASPRPTLLIAMGGSDPMGLTLKTAEALATLDPVFRARFVIGPGVADGARVAKHIVKLGAHFETIEGAGDLATEYAASDLAVAAFGVTAYELAAYGVPALYLCLTDDHALSASACEQAGMGVSLGLAERAQNDDIARAAWSLLGDPSRRRDMRNAGLTTIDADGAARVASDLATQLNARRANAPKAARG